MAEQLISTSVHHTLPQSYVRNEAERPRLDEVVPDATIPVVDLSDPDRAAVVAQIGAACRSHGFFQVLNHGLPVELMQSAMAVAHDFFRLSPEEKAKLYSDDPAKKMRLSTSFNVRKETVHNWRDYLRLHCHPLEQFVPEWPANPPPFSAWCVGDGSIQGVARLQGHAKAVTGVAVPDGSRMLYSTSRDGTVRTWDSATWQCVHVAPIHEDEMSTLTAMGQWLLAGARGAVRALHTGSGEEHRLPLPAAWTQITALLNDDEHLFAGAEDGAIYIWRLDRERRRFEEVAALAGHDGHAVASLARLKGALYSGAVDGGVKDWDLETRRCVCSFAGHTSKVTALLCWGQFLLSSSDDGTVKIWRSKKQDHNDGVDLELEVVYTHHREEEGDQRVVAMDKTNDADGKPVLLVAWGDGVVRVYDLPSFKTRGEIHCDGAVTAISLRTPGMVFTGDETGEIRVAKWTPAAAAAAA